MGYSVTKCKINNGLVITTNEVLIENIDCDYDIIVNVEEKLYSITYNNIVNGSIYCNSQISDINEGETRIFKFIADEGYVLKGIYLNDELIEIEDNVLSILVDKNIKLDVKFEALKSPITIHLVVALILPTATIFVFLGIRFVKHYSIKKVI